MAFKGKQIKDGSVATAKLATASVSPAASSVVVSKTNSKIDIGYIPTDDPLLARNFSYTTLASTDVITVPDGQTMLFYNTLKVGDGLLVVDGVVTDTQQDLSDTKPWNSTIFTGAGPHTLSIGKTNRYDNTSNAAMVLWLPSRPGHGVVLDLKEIGGSTNSVTLTTAAGTVLIENLASAGSSTSITLTTAKRYLSLKFDLDSATWRCVGLV